MKPQSRESATSPPARPGLGLWLLALCICAGNMRLLLSEARCLPPLEALSLGTVLLGAVFFGFLGGRSKSTTFTLANTALLVATALFAIRTRSQPVPWAYIHQTVLGFGICCAPFVCFIGLLSQVVTMSIIEWWRREAPGTCDKCGYDLTGNLSGICPECGTPIPKATPVENDDPTRVQAIREPSEKP